MPQLTPPQKFHQPNTFFQNQNPQRMTQNLHIPQRPVRPISQIQPQMQSHPQMQMAQKNPFVPNNKPEPMEVDPSIRSRQINYGNRLQNSTQFNQQQKRPRMFNILSDQSDETEFDPTLDAEHEAEYFDTDIPTDDSTFQRYMQQWETQEKEEEFAEEKAEFNFLG